MKFYSTILALVLTVQSICNTSPMTFRPNEAYDMALEEALLMDHSEGSSSSLAHAMLNLDLEQTPIQSKNNKISSALKKIKAKVRTPKPTRSESFSIVRPLLKDYQKTISKSQYEPQEIQNSVPHDEYSEAPMSQYESQEPAVMHESHIEPAVKRQDENSDAYPSQVEESDESGQEGSGFRVSKIVQGRMKSFQKALDEHSNGMDMVPYLEKDEKGKIDVEKSILSWKANGAQFGPPNLLAEKWISEKDRKIIYGRVLPYLDNYPFNGPLALRLQSTYGDFHTAFALLTDEKDLHADAGNYLTLQDRRAKRKERENSSRYY